MNCRKCGAVLLDTDTFCVKCGQRVDQPMFCSKCGEQLRDGERFCHNCGSPVDSAPEDDEIPLSKQRTVDIPFDQIEQAILLEAEQAVVKRPKTGRPERRNPEDYSRPGAEEKTEHRQPDIKDRDLCGQPPVREPEYADDSEEEDERYEMQRRPKRRTPPPRPRYEEEYDDYDEDDDSGDSRMKIVTTILGIAVVAIALVIGFTFWQRSRTPGYGEAGETAEQGEEGEESEGGDQSLAETKGRIQILSNVNVRNKPTTEGSEVMMVAKTGETYEYYELVDGAWYHIALEDGRDGYVSEKYVEDLQ